MDLVKLEERPVSRILVQPKDGDVTGLRSCFEVARSLREAGYLVALDQGQKAVGDYRWLLSVSGEGLFRLTDQATGGKCELTSEAEIRQVMENSR